MATTQYAKGIAVNSKSEISGPQWVKKIDTCKYIPDDYRKIYWVKGRITVEKRFKRSAGVIPKTWETDYLSGFHTGDWEISTHHLNVSVETGAKSAKRPQRQSGQKIPIITIELVPHLSKGEELGKLMRVGQSGTDLKKLTVARGWTFKRGTPSIDGIIRSGAVLKSGRRLMTIGTRINLNVGATKQIFRYIDWEHCETFFHEIACHAGRITQGLKSVHGPGTTVNHIANDIRRMFPPKQITLNKLRKAVDRLLKKLRKTEKRTNRGSLGLHNNPVIDSGTLARIESRPPGLIRA